MEIWAVVKDPGGIDGVLPIVSSLRDFGYKVQIIANGKALEILKGKMEHLSYDNAEELLRDKSLPRVLLTSMCSGGGVGRDLVPLVKGKIPVVAIQSLWGVGLQTDWREEKYRPDYIVVNDTVGERIVKQCWPDYAPQRIIKSGFPALDKYFGVDTVVEKQKVCAMLGLEKNIPIILFGGQGDATGHSLEELVICLNYINCEVYLIPRPHPRTKDNFRSEMALWQKALAKLRGATLVVDFFNQVGEVYSFVAAADVVISMYSTMLMEAAVLRLSNISILYPDQGMFGFYSDTGRVMQEPPLVSLGCSQKAANRGELRHYLYEAIHGDLGLRQAQETHFKLDGKNALRAAYFIGGLLRTQGL